MAFGRSRARSQPLSCCLILIVFSASLHAGSALSVSSGVRSSQLQPLRQGQAVESRYGPRKAVAGHPCATGHGPRKAVAFIDWDGKGASDWSRTAAKSAMIFNTGVPVYVATDAAQTTAKDMRLDCPSAEHKFHVVDLGALRNKDQREISFTQDYVHSSINKREYEMNCFRRFFWLRQLMKVTGLRHVLLADADMMFLGNVFRSYGLTDKLPFFALSRTSTYFSYWSLKILDEFCSYIHNFYKRPKEEVFADIGRYGLVRGSAGHEWAIGPKPSAEGWPAWMTPKQFSDMWIFTAFLDHRPDLQAHLKFPRVHPPEIWRPLEILHKLKSQSGICYTLDNVSSQEFRWAEISREQQRFLMPVVNGTQPAALHFQGDCKSSMVGAARRIGIGCP